MLTVACTGPATPCEELCDGTARCIDGNAACEAEGLAGDGDFVADCVRLCEAAGTGLTASEEAEALTCLDCLRAGTDFDSCNGETALDTVCRDQCRTDGAIVVRNSFGPALFDERPAIDCLRR